MKKLKLYIETSVWNFFFADDAPDKRDMIDPSLQEVWDWKDKVYEDTKGLSMKEAIENIRKGAEDFCEKYGLKVAPLRRVHPAGHRSPSDGRASA